MTPRERIKAMIQWRGPTAAAPYAIPHICGWGQVREHLYVISRMLHFVDTDLGFYEMPMESWRLARGVSSYLGGGDVETVLRVMCAMGVASRRRDGRRFVYRLSADMTAPETTSRPSIGGEVDDIEETMRANPSRDPEWLRHETGGRLVYHIIAVGLACGRYEMHRAGPATPIGVRFAQ